MIMIPGMLRRLIWRIWRILVVLVWATAVTVVIAPEWPEFGTDSYQIRTIVGLNQFNFFNWQAEAIIDKAKAVLANGQSYLPEENRKQIVLDYLEMIGQARQLTSEIEKIYADPATTDPETAAAPLQQQLNSLRKQMTFQQPLAEAIIQDQVSVILKEEGFALTGQVLPPVMVHMTPLPMMLIVSPRDHIEQVDRVALTAGLPVAEQEAMETAVFDNLNLSALVVPIGGLSTYPSMIMEYNSINWLAEVTAHEWTHHWLTLRPLGLNYTDPDARTINETVASIVDEEVGQQVIARFYPEFLPPETTQTETAPQPANPPAFDFRAEMAQTRIEVDEMLANGEIERAEAYMEARRRVFVENGYLIRKLNQAYFAFYGSYAAQPGATGTNPIGPMLREIRSLSPSLKFFLTAVAPVDSREKLETLLNDLRAAAVAVDG
ncbi:MAG: hypothetical protein Kow0080_20410 [Candidatus Promineifilaceae bacterium]